MEKQTIERGKLRKAVGRQSEESRKAVGRQGRMSNVGRSQGRKESMKGITVRGGQEIGIERLRSNGGGCGDGLRRGGEE